MVLILAWNLGSMTMAHVKEDDPRYNRPQCYCHGDRHEQGNGYITSQIATNGVQNTPMPLIQRKHN